MGGQAVLLPRRMSSSGIVRLLGQFLETGLADFVGAADRLFDMEMKAQVTGQDLQPIGVSLAASIRPRKPIRPSWPVDGVVGTGGRWQGDVFPVDVDGAHSTTFTPAVLASLSSLEYATCDIANIPINATILIMFSITSSCYLFLNSLSPSDSIIIFKVVRKCDVVHILF